MLIHNYRNRIIYLREFQFPQIQYFSSAPKTPIRFINLEKIDKDGIRQIFDTKGYYIPRVYSNLDDEYPQVMNATAGDRYFFNNICLESPVVPCDYSFSVLITENELAINLPKIEGINSNITYLIDGKNSSEEDFKKLKEEDIESLVVRNRWGEIVTLKEKGNLIIVIKTKNLTTTY